MAGKKKAAKVDNSVDTIQELKDLKFRYTLCCNRYGCDPIQQILKRIDDCISTGEELAQVMQY
jgi:hypothetical protein